MTRLDEPALDWQQIARGFGVPAVRVEKAEDLNRELQNTLSEAGPRVIEMLF